MGQKLLENPVVWNYKKMLTYKNSLIWIRGKINVYHQIYALLLITNFYYSYYEMKTLYDDGIQHT